MVEFLSGFSLICVYCKNNVDIIEFSFVNKYMQVNTT